MTVTNYTTIIYVNKFMRDALLVSTQIQHMKNKFLTDDFAHTTLEICV